MTQIDIVNLHKSYGNVEVLHDISLAIADGEFVVLVGPSGCGKSTLLRAIAGLEPITSGIIAFDGHPVNDLSPQQRQVAMVFQNYALYPHMTVRDNMAFTLRLRGYSKAEIRQRVERTAALLKISDFLDRRPRQLSGGQRQRVAMGRAMVREGVAFLFDEPLSNLDAKLRVEMRSEIRNLQAKIGATSIYVTHDQIEAMTMGDRIVVMNNGGIEQAGSPLELYEKPANLFVASFIGSPQMNFIEAEGRGRTAALADGTTVALPVEATGRLTLGFRPEHLSFVTPASSNRTMLRGTVKRRYVLGAQTGTICDVAGREFEIMIPGVGQAPNPVVDIAAERIYVFDASGERIC